MTGVFAATVLGLPVSEVLWLFVGCSFLGVVIETSYVLVCDQVLTSTSGLLYLPLRPLYGFGGCAFALLLPPVAGHPALVFVLGALLATVVEFLGSLLSEALWGAVCWDYGHLPLNVQGRVCASYSVCWGVLALVAVYLLDRPALRLLDTVPQPAGRMVLSVVMVLVLLSTAVTVLVLGRVRRRVLVLRSVAGGQETATRGTALDRPIDRLVDRLGPDRVVAITFPRLPSVVELLELTGRCPGPDGQVASLSWRRRADPVRAPGRWSG